MVSLTNRFPKYLERRLKNLNPLRMLNSLTESLRAGSDLTAEQVTDSVAHMTAEAIPPEAKADFLTALAEKGETADELAAFAFEQMDKDDSGTLEHAEVEEAMAAMGFRLSERERWGRCLLTLTATTAA